MDTKTVVSRTPQEFEMQERKGPKFIKWDGSGVIVSGVLLRVESIEIEDERTHEKKRAARYTVQDPADGEFYAFLGTADINQKLSKADLGRYVEVSFTGKEDADAGKHGNAMKLFRVAVSIKRASDVITDEDIPF